MGEVNNLHTEEDTEPRAEPKGGRVQEVPVETNELPRRTTAVLIQVEEVVEAVHHPNHCRQKREAPKLMRIMSEGSGLPRRIISLLSTSTMKPLARIPRRHRRTKRSMKKAESAGYIFAPPNTTLSLVSCSLASSLPPPTAPLLIFPGSLIRLLRLYI